MFPRMRHLGNYPRDVQLRNTPRQRRFNVQLIRTCTKGTEAMIYICSRGIGVHYGKSDQCGRRCLNAREANGTIYDKESTSHYLVVKKKFKFNTERMTEDGEAFIGHRRNKQAANHPGDGHATSKDEPHSADPCEDTTIWNVVELFHDRTPSDKLFVPRSNKEIK